MPQTSARPQERDRLRKRAVSFALLCAAGHILLSSDERAARPAYGAGIAPAALLCAAGHILLPSGERAACPAYGAGIAPAALLCAAGHILLSSDERAARPAYGAGIAPAALLCAAGHILLPSGERAACPAYGAGIAPAAPFYVGTDDKAGMPPFARPAASGGHKSRISRRVCQLPAGSLLQRQTIPQPEPCGSGSSLYTREPAMRKKPARRAAEDKRSDWQVVLCARGARASSQGLCPPRLWRHEPQAKYNEEPPAKPVSFSPPFTQRGIVRCLLMHPFYSSAPACS